MKRAAYRAIGYLLAHAACWAFQQARRCGGAVGRVRVRFRRRKRDDASSEVSGMRDTLAYQTRHETNGPASFVPVP